MKKLLLLLILVFPSVELFAEVIEERTITKMNAYSNRAVVYFSPSYSNSLNCGSTSTNRAIIDYEEGSVQGKEMYSMAMTAAVTGKAVNLAINSCYGSLPRIYRVDVYFQ